MSTNNNVFLVRKLPILFLILISNFSVFAAVPANQRLDAGEFNEQLDAGRFPVEREQVVVPKSTPMTAPLTASAYPLTPISLLATLHLQ